jgi:hypothetical protein
MESLVLWSLTVWPAKGLNNFISAASVVRLCEAVKVQSVFYKDIRMSCSISTPDLTQLSKLGLLSYSYDEKISGICSCLKVGVIIIIIIINQ